jgi:Na+/H+-translocating membrane pyrophosphatase
MRLQLFIIAFTMLGALYLAAFITFPSQFTLTNIYERYYDVQKIWIPYICSVIGLITVLLLSLFNEFIASPAFFPVQSLVESSRSSSAANLANGLALGYISTIIPIILIASAAYLANMFLGFYGVGLAAIGAVCGFPIFLAHSIFAPLASNAHQMAKLS